MNFITSSHPNIRFTRQGVVRWLKFMSMYCSCRWQKFGSAPPAPGYQMASFGICGHCTSMQSPPHTHTHTILNNFTIELIFKMQFLTKNLKRDRIISGHIFTLAYLWLFFSCGFMILRHWRNALWLLICRITEWFQLFFSWLLIICYCKSTNYIIYKF